MSDTEIIRSELELFIAQEKALLPEHEEVSDLIAKKQRIYYNSLVKQGFSKKEALELLMDADIYHEVFGDNEDFEL